MSFWIDAYPLFLLEMYFLKPINVQNPSKAFWDLQ